MLWLVYHLGKRSSIRDTYAGVVGVPLPPPSAILYTSGISQELCFVSVLYQYFLPPSAVYSFHG